MGFLISIPFPRQHNIFCPQLNIVKIKPEAPMDLRKFPKGKVYIKG